MATGKGIGGIDLGPRPNKQPTSYLSQKLGQPTATTESRITATTPDSKKPVERSFQNDTLIELGEVQKNSQPSGYDPLSSDIEEDLKFKVLIPTPYSPRPIPYMNSNKSGTPLTSKVHQSKEEEKNYGSKTDGSQNDWKLSSSTLPTDQWGIVNSKLEKLSWD